MGHVIEIDGYSLLFKELQALDSDLKELGSLLGSGGEWCCFVLLQ